MLKPSSYNSLAELIHAMARHEDYPHVPGRHLAPYPFEAIQNVVTLCPRVSQQFDFYLAIELIFLQLENTGEISSVF